MSDRIKAEADFCGISEEAVMSLSMPVSELCKSLGRIADAIQEQAEATRMLAAATAGEFDGDPEQAETGGLS